VNEKIGVVGLGYIGLPLVVALANVGYEVVGMDIDQKIIEHLKDTYEPGIYEPGLAEALKRHKHVIELTTSYAELMGKCDVILITVGTPIKEDNTPNWGPLDAVITAMDKHLRKGQLIILKSTVTPGTTREMARRLQEASRLKAGSDFYIAFYPERTIEGMALHELHTLSKIIGGINTESTDRAARIISKLGGRIIKVSSPEAAEMCKLIDNTYRSLNIALANEIGLICEKIGLDDYEIVSAVNQEYARTHLSKCGLGAGGPCLSKDPQILTHFAREKGVDTKIISASIINNIKATLRVAEIASEYIKALQITRPKVSLIGLAFKGFPETNDTRNSPAIIVKQALQNAFNNIEFGYYDPLVNNFYDNSLSPTLKECIQDANVIIFMTNHPSLTGVQAEDILDNSGRPLLVIDCWHNVANPDKIKRQGARIFRLGDGTL